MNQKNTQTPTKFYRKLIGKLCQNISLDASKLLRHFLPLIKLTSLQLFGVHNDTAAGDSKAREIPLTT